MTRSGIAGARPHRLSDAAFAALGAGRPDAATVGELRRAQLSRHLLLLREIAAVAPAGEFASLVAQERADPPRVREMLARPLTGVWAAGCLSALRVGSLPEEAGVGYLADLAAGPPRRAERRLTAAHDGLSISVRIEDRDPLRARLGLTPAARLTDAQVARWQHLLAEAWRLLVGRVRPQAAVLAAVLDCVVPVEADPAARGISASSADAFGAVAMSEPADATALAVGLLHETQHSVLNAVNYLFDLHDDPDALGYSPWRDDPRPASGILHGAYAYLNVARFRRSGAGDPLAAFEFARWRSAVVAAADELLGRGGLTAAGIRFVTALRAEALPWLDDPVAPEVARLAAGANADHRLRWRLRNLRVEPADAAALAGAWRRGDPAPLVASHLHRAPRRALEASARLDQAHAVLRGEPVDTAGGDSAYLRGDLDAAAHAYRSSVILDPGDRAAWAGLALAGGLGAEPEIVAAAYLALDDRNVDPVTLAGWLSS
ncbi:aKG-HExxH-type peptide beta-hydroxylase [Actinoplanes sp. NPDC026623]|uniref:aKG-HExxH-type peptide beta-hydroxylase n=1 Tax=Actinoplanes sp. NPDC026623 TaxID=3155610 RepID=UPI0033EAF645